MRYFVMKDGEQCGPYRVEELEAAGVTPETYVWCKGMADWQQAGEVADICRYFRNLLHDRMHPTAMQPAPQQSAPTYNLDDIPLRWRGFIMKSGVPAYGAGERAGYDNASPNVDSSGLGSADTLLSADGYRSAGVWNKKPEVMETGEAE